MRSAIVLAGLLLACGAESGGVRESEPASLAPVVEHVGGAGKPSAGTSTGGTANASGGNSSAGTETAMQTGGAGGTTSGGTSSGVAGSINALGGMAGSEQGGQAGSSAGQPGATAGQAGTGGAAPLPFNCHDPKPEDGLEWRVYTVKSGHCLAVGNASWSGENVCRETSPHDGTCAASCAAYLSVRVGLLDEPLTIAVLLVNGIVIESSSFFEDANSSAACRAALEGTFP